MIIYKVCTHLPRLFALPLQAKQHTSAIAASKTFPFRKASMRYHMLTHLAGYHYRRRDHLRLLQLEGDRRGCLRSRLQKD